MPSKLSVAIATFNEEKNIKDCLKSVENIADEIVIVDGSSTDNTVNIAKSFNAKVIIRDNPPNFHINKQLAFDKAMGDWILYLDADERVSKQLADEILKVTRMNQKEIENYQTNLQNKNLFLKHQELLNLRDGQIGKSNGEFVAFFFPRLNFFLGKFLKHGGSYPDGVIRLFRKDKAYLPCKSVHEQMVVLGKVGWLKNNLLHYDSPTFSRYLKRNSRYINLMVLEFKKTRLEKNLDNFVDYVIIKPIWWFFSTYFLRKGLLDGTSGLIFSFFSALRFPRAYIKFLLT